MSEDRLVIFDTTLRDGEQSPGIALTPSEKLLIAQQLEKLKVDGFDAAYTEVNPEGLHRVAYGRFVSKKEALNLHNYIRYALKEDAWFLVEK